MEKLYEVVISSFEYAKSLGIHVETCAGIGELVCGYTETQWDNIFHDKSGILARTQIPYDVMPESKCVEVYSISGKFWEMIPYKAVTACSDSPSAYWEYDPMTKDVHPIKDESSTAEAVAPVIDDSAFKLPATTITELRERFMDMSTAYVTSHLEPVISYVDDKAKDSDEDFKGELLSTLSYIADTLATISEKLGIKKEALVIEGFFLNFI